MVVIRLSRTGTNKRPFYHVVVADRRMPRDGRYIERLGYFNPIAAGKEIPLCLKTDRVEYWLSQGAQPSDRVDSLLKDWKKQGQTAAEAA
ncbi:MAG: ribosomal protein [Gammaproteobacteria bacterium]|jgi:small subunit ribosomal protein S16|nr:ribosomal protein [Gammaproteobacteria bacterium]